jgi:hypothetical protein
MKLTFQEIRIIAIGPCIANIKLVLLGYNIKLVLLGYNIKLVFLGYNKMKSKNSTLLEQF